jgi:predicted metalloprotease with PDZ domain
MHSPYFRPGRGLVLASLLGLMGLAAGAVEAPVTHLTVDAREAPRGILSAHLQIAVQPGPLTLVYPKWLPGYHAPKGPITSLGGLYFRINGTALPWRRDEVDMYAFHLDIPAGATSLDAQFEVLASPHSEEDTPGLAQPRIATESLLILEWHEVVLYPAGAQTDALPFEASVQLPAGWQFATALPVRERRADGATFAAVPLTNLVDSPLLAGRYFRSIELGGSPPVRLNVAGDNAAAIDLSSDHVAAYRNLVREETAAFGATHYRHYDFLWLLTDTFMPDGIEHHEESDNRSPERTFADADVFRVEAALLPHEYTHSWNGKYRRPSGLATGNYQEPMRTELLWVYEGLTEYLGDVMAARSGLWTGEDFREELARIAALMDTHKARAWRSLQDAATAAQLLYVQNWDWAARLRRQDDFYQESALLWLEADVLIRNRSQGRRSLDDFLRAFYGGPSGTPRVMPYSFTDVCDALNGVLQYDWRSFWRERLDRLRPGAPLEGILGAGWQLEYTAEPNRLQKGHETEDKNLDLRHSLGFIVSDESRAVADVVPGSAADRAGVAPGMHIVALGGEPWSKPVLQAALAAARHGPLELLVEKDHRYRTLTVDYTGAERSPHLVRRGGTSDLLSQITHSISRPTN